MRIGKVRDGLVEEEELPLRTSRIKKMQARIRKSNKNKVMSLYAHGGPGRDSEAG